MPFYGEYREIMSPQVMAILGESIRNIPNILRQDRFRRAFMDAMSRQSAINETNVPAIFNREYAPSVPYRFNQDIGKPQGLPTFPLPRIQDVNDMIPPPIMKSKDLQTPVANVPSDDDYYVKAIKKLFEKYPYETMQYAPGLLPYILPKPEEPFVLSPGQAYYGNGGRVIYSLPPNPITVSPGEQLVTPSGEPIYKYPEKKEEEKKSGKKYTGLYPYMSEEGIQYATLGDDGILYNATTGERVKKGIPPASMDATKYQLEIVKGKMEHIEKAMEELNKLGPLMNENQKRMFEQYQNEYNELARKQAVLMEVYKDWLSGNLGEDYELQYDLKKIDEYLP